jgi:hypothetical protein
VDQDPLKLLAGILAVAVLASCKAAAAVDLNRVWSVDEVIESIDALNGKTVRVSGYLGHCGVYDCPFFQDRQAKQQRDRWWAAVNGGKKHQKPPRWLGIGGFPEFDSKANALAESYVLLTAKVSNKCLSHGKPQCTDRSSDLEPIRIEPLRRSGTKS